MQWLTKCSYLKFWDCQLYLWEYNWQQLINKLLNKLLEEINEIDKSDKVNYYRQDIFKQLCTYKDSMDSIENEIIYLLSYHPMVSTVDLLHEISNKLLENTLAFYLATQEEKIC